MTTDPQQPNGNERWRTCRHCGRPIFKATRNGVRQWFHGDPKGGATERWATCQDGSDAEPSPRGATSHDVTITFHRGWSEYRPDCSCGWVGSYWESAGQAKAEASTHSDRAEKP